jgi:trehalose 6-phosphate synthase/phosphatase
MRLHSPDQRVEQRSWFTGSPSGFRAPRIVFASNRLPWTLDAEYSRLLPSAGGLATALGSIHRRGQSLWIGWLGQPGDLSEFGWSIRQQLRAARAVAVPLTADDVDRYYHGYSNSLLWPILHGFPPPPTSEVHNWHAYQRVNEHFARTIAAHASPGDYVWVHDFHLMLVPRLLRAFAPAVRTGFFLHTPFPDPAAFAGIQRAGELLEGVLAADLIGLQTPADIRSFLQAVDRADTQAQRVDVRAYPIGIDVHSFETNAALPRVEEQVKLIRKTGIRLLLGVDRLDFTKGIPQRLLAYERLLSNSPELRGTIRLIQLAVPSRETLSAYNRLRKRVEALVARINFRFGHADWTPVDFRYETVDTAELVALYRAADVMLVTPMADGMNLVAKEFVASRIDGDGVLVLSRTAGAATELKAALLIDPRSVSQTAAMLHAALMMSAAERKARMRSLRATVTANDTTRWANRFMSALNQDRPVSLHASS